MVSSFASQLQAIAQKSTHELDLKARRSAHAESLLFDRDIAAKQDFETIYNICIEGYRELCQLDERFVDFDRNLFSEQAKAQDREQMNRSENEALDLVLKRCLMLLGGKILLKPALKALEWLVRRFRVHVYNVNDLLLMLLPYHEVAVWANALSIISGDKIVGSWKFVRPYLKTTWNVPRHAVAYAASNNDGFFSALNAYALEVFQQGLAHPSMAKFWSVLVVEAVANRLTQTRSGRKEVQNQRTEDLLHKVLPLLSEGYEIPGSADLITTCYTITILLAAKAELGDHVLDSLLLAVAQSLTRTDHDVHAAFITMTIIISHKKEPKVPKQVLEILADVDPLTVVLRRLSKEYHIETFLIATISSAMSHVKRRNVHKLAMLVESLVYLVKDLYPSADLADTVRPIIHKLIQLNPENEAEAQIRNQLLAKVQKLNEVEAISKAIADTATNEKHDSSVLEGLLGMTISLPHPPAEMISTEVSMVDALPEAADAEHMLNSLPTVWQEDTSCLSISISGDFDQLANVFESCFANPEMFSKFSNLPIWSSTSSQTLLWQTFLLRFACTNRDPQARSRALHVLMESIKSDPACDVQNFVPYALVLLSDVKLVRQTASELVTFLRELLSAQPKQRFEKNNGLFYASEKLHSLSLSNQHVDSFLTTTVSSVLEESVLDPAYIVTRIQKHLQHNAHESRKGEIQTIITLLANHALATPLVKVKMTILSMLDKVQKASGKLKTKLLLPILQQWSTLSETQAQTVADEGGVALDAVDASFVQLADFHDDNFLDKFAEAAASSEHRLDLIAALFRYISQMWATWTFEQQVSAANSLFNMAFSPNGAIANGAQDVLKTIDLRSDILAILLQLSQAGSSEVKGPPTKRRKRSSSGNATSRADAVKSIENATSRIGLALELVDSNVPELKIDMIPSMFEMLASLKQLQQNRVTSPYLVNLCLTSIHAMLQSAQESNRKIDASAVKPELVTDCLRNSENPQVQNSSLLVLSTMSTIVPDMMVHNVMPIFTFIGHNMLSKDDEHSIYVINEAIDKIVPALLETLRRGKNSQNYQTSIAAMLSSFTSAYDHIPLHRRVAFYQKLLYCVHPGEYGFMLVALLANQRSNDVGLTRFVQDLLVDLSTLTQLRIYQQLLSLAMDSLSSTPKSSSIIFNIQRSTNASEKQLHAQSSLVAAGAVLKTSSLVANIQKPLAFGQENADGINREMQNAFNATLSSIRDTKNVDGNISSLAKQNMDLLLKLPKVADLLEVMRIALDNMDQEFRPQALRVLASQLDVKRSKNDRIRERAMGVLEKLNTYLSSTMDDSFLQACLVCVDRISEIYGRKSPDLVVSTAQRILLTGLYQDSRSDKTQVSLVLTMASLVEVIKEGTIPLVSDLLEQTSLILDSCATKTSTTRMFDAVCMLLSAVFSNVAFVVSEEKLQHLLKQVFRVRVGLKRQDETPDYAALLQTIARKVDLETTVRAALAQMQIENDLVIAAELMNLLSSAIDATPKSAVVKCAEDVSHTFQLVLELESMAVDKALAVNKSITDNGVLSSLKEASIKFIYKVNDTTFRPLFESWIDWATTSDDASGNMNPVSRQIALFDLLAHFFNNLKAIVTSYAAYILKSIATILETAVTGSASQVKTHHTPKSNSTTIIPLATSALSLLKTITAHDQDSFFAAPSHFETIASPLISCLNLAATKSTRAIVTTHVLPNIISLATATIDSPSTHSTLTHHIAQLKSSSSSHVRLASIRTLLALTEDEEVGDEFIANVIGVGAGEGEGARGGGGSFGEIMVYVNEMLEDDDEAVETEVRRWVQAVRAKVGEDVFEF